MLSPAEIELVKMTEAEFRQAQALRESRLRLVATAHNIPADQPFTILPKDGGLVVQVPE